MRGQDTTENIVTYKNMERPEHRKNQTDYLVALPTVFQMRSYFKH